MRVHISASTRLHQMIGSMQLIPGLTKDQFRYVEEISHGPLLADFFFRLDPEIKLARGLVIVPCTVVPTPHQFLVVPLYDIKSEWQARGGVLAYLVAIG